MVRSRKVVAERLGGIFADKDCSCVANLRHYLERILRHKLQVLRCNLVDRCNRIVQTVGNQNVSVILQRFCDDLLSRQLLHKAVDLSRHLPGKRAACGNQNSGSHLVMLRLRQQVRRHITRIRCLVRKDKDLARSRNRVDADITEHSLFCKCHIDISWAYNLVHLRDALGSERHRSDRLRAAHLIDGVHARLLCRHECGRIDFPVCSRRCRHNDLLHTRHFCRNDIHEHRRRVDGLAARHIHADSRKRSHLLS